MLAPEFFKKIGRSWFRMHYQFIMANDLRAPYEYMMLVCGPVAVEQWARRGQEMLARFAADASYRARLSSGRATTRISHSTSRRGSSRGEQGRELVVGARDHHAPPAHQPVIALLRHAARRCATGSAGSGSREFRPAP